MSNLVSKWVILQQHTVGADDVDGDGSVRDDVLAHWVDEARVAYLECCTSLREASDRAGCVVTFVTGELPSGARLGAAQTVNVSAGATEVWPTAFAISFRIRTYGSSDDVAFSASCRVSLEDPTTGQPCELGVAVRDELIALAHAAKHYN